MNRGSDAGALAFCITPGQIAIPVSPRRIGGKVLMAGCLFFSRAVQPGTDGQVALVCDFQIKTEKYTLNNLKSLPI
jgi:hypothetical protein